MIQTGTYFSTKDDIQEILLNALDEANNKVFLAVAWLTDKTLFGKLKELQGRGVGVEVIIANHESNHNSGINYSELNAAGGEIIIMGDGEGIMHNKFCVIDYNIVCMGSYNWTYSARNRNQEFLNLEIGNARMVDDFVQEFKRLKEMAGSSLEFSTPDLSETIQILHLIKAFINLKQPNQITPYIYQLELVPEASQIVEALKSQSYEKAIQIINEFFRDYTIPVSTRHREIAELNFKIQYYSYQVNALEVEKAQVESELEQFIHRYIIELNPQILKILELKKKIYHKLRKYGVIDETYEELDKEFNEAQETLEEEAEIIFPNLSEDELKTIKQLHREGVSMCHPDSPGCIYDNKIEASGIFDQLTKAYKANDIERVRFLVQEMRLGKKINSEHGYDEVERLRAKLMTLEQKYKLLLSELLEIKSSDYYKKMPPREEWNDYFENSKNKLEIEYNNLVEKFTKP